MNGPLHEMNFLPSDFWDSLKTEYFSVTEKFKKCYLPILSIGLEETEWSFISNAIIIKMTKFFILGVPRRKNHVLLWILFR